jgi:hypothetical protein
MNVHQFVQLYSLGQISSSLTPSTEPRSIFLQLFRHRGGFLFHRFILTPSTVQWLQDASVLVSKLILKNYNDQSHQYLMEHKDFVEELDFHHSPGLLDKHLKELDRCPALTSLSLANCAKISDSTLQQFLKSNPQLERLNISDTREITRGIMPALQLSGQNIQYLDVSRHEWFNSDCLRLLVTSWPRLKSINFSRTYVEMKTVVELLKMKPEIQSIGYSMAPIYEKQATQTFLLEFALRSLMSDDLVSQNMGLDNLREFMTEDKDYQNHLPGYVDDKEAYVETVRSAGAMPRILRSLFQSVSFLFILLPFDFSIICPRNFKLMLGESSIS